MDYKIMSKIKFDNVEDYKDMYLNLADNASKSLINILSTTGRIEFDADKGIQPTRHFDDEILTIKAISYDADKDGFLLELDNGWGFYDDFDDNYYDLFYVHEAVRCHLILNKMLDN